MTRCAMLRDEWPVRPGRDQCVAVIGDDSTLIDGETDALNSNAGCSKLPGMKFSEEMESAPTGSVSLFDGRENASICRKWFRRVSWR